ncbi:BgTH12-07049 [Blumeria graminis f. sp. triticale]|uniref:Glycine cleavage system H protein n=3 Tax=Blumeria graminis TaxID=34373 RepID=A0A061HS02_BLUGR|nr:H subunit of the mitochondrial glycine decarboxylase complex [Blumeria graminis f. sp. tritici 96224]CAD6506119.1 BgTH12-07049 [Blumeria graminis f. sp. triticale]VDB94806.1 Bgt-803 [Blumeria graminis f. sp. tritici]
MSSFTRAFRPVLFRSKIPRCSKFTPFVRCSAARNFSATPIIRAKKFTKDHEWIEVSEDGKTGTMGITEYASKSLGDVVYVELPEVKLQAVKGESIGAVESVKSASDINAPVACTITAVNQSLEDSPKIINDEPEKSGWLAKVELSESGINEMHDLMDLQEYKDFTEKDDH